jgi:hypothetical protein
MAGEFFKIIIFKRLTNLLECLGKVYEIKLIVFGLLSFKLF